MRKLGDIKETDMPEVGRHNCEIISTKFIESKEKKTPGIEITMTNGITKFTDTIYVTAKTINRLSLFAKRVCEMDENTTIPDDDLQAANFIGNFIMHNGAGKKCIVTIAEYEEKFIPTYGPDMGRTKTIKKRKVAFNGYETIADQPTESQIQEAIISNDDFFQIKKK